MPSLTKKNDRLLLVIADSPELEKNTDVRAFLRTILDYKFDPKKNQYQYTDTRNTVKTSKIIQDTVEFCEKFNVKCNLDSYCKQRLEDSNKSQTSFSEARSSSTAIRTGGTPHLELSPNFKRTLKPYQIKPVKHLFEVGYGANFSVPGSGKTTITYAAFSLWKQRGIANKIMVMGPRSSFMTWEEEFVQCFGKKARSLRLDGNKVCSLPEIANDRDLILCTYQLMSNHATEIIELLSGYQILLVLDESHHVKRLSGGLWSESVLRISPYATRRVILSGTPMPQSAIDLWTQFTFLWPHKNLLGESVSYKRYVKNHKGLGKFSEEIRPFYTRITKDSLGLEPARPQKIIVPLRKYQRKIYDTLALLTLQEIESSDERTRLRMWRRNKIIRLLQAASNPSLLSEFSSEFTIPPLSGEGLPVSALIEKYSKYEIPSKLFKAAAIARDLIKSGEKVIIWTTFVHNITVLQNELLKEYSPLIIRGDVPKDDEENEQINREKIIRQFKNKDEPQILIATPSSLSESVSLHKNKKGNTVCKTAIYVDRTFNAGQYMQSLDRIHRIGLDPGTQVRYILLVGEGTIDEAIHDRLSEKITSMYHALNDDISVLDLEASQEKISDAQLNLDFERTYEYLKKRKREENDQKSA